MCPIVCQKIKSIPVDTIPITMSAEGLTPVDTTVTTNSKRGSERTLQSSKKSIPCQCTK